MPIKNNKAFPFRTAAKFLNSKLRRGNALLIVLYYTIKVNNRRKTSAAPENASLKGDGSE